MKRIGLALKIWLAMFALIVLVLGLAAVFQSSLIGRIYINQQADRILESGTSFAREAVLSDQAEVDRNVAALAGALNASVTVVDSGGTVIGWSGRRGMGGNGRWGMMGGRGRGPAVTVDPSDIKSVLAGETLIKKGGSQSAAATDVLLVAIPVQRQGKTSGALFIQSPMAPIEANIRSIKEAVLYSLLLGIAAATLLALLFSRRVTGPILKMNSVARSMAKGDFEQKIPFKSGDELGMLADSINTLSGQLKEKIRTIEELDSTRKSFVANISHELRTPLTIMQGYTEALLDGIAQDEKQREKYLLNIHGETVRLSRLVNDVLDLRRLESGQISINMEETDISALIRAVSEQFSDASPEKEVRVVYTVADDKIIARVDSDRLKQVVINLVDNAVRYSPEGGTVQIRGERAGEKVKVAVIDQGPGIAEKDRELIWERFYKTDDSWTERSYSGSGLGLAIARQIIDLHGGEIGVESAPGKGSAFWFTLHGA